MTLYKTSTNNFGTAALIVDPTAGQGTHTTIAAALTDATSGQTIFIRPSTYVENLTLKAGVSLTGYVCDGSGSSSALSNGNVIISGKSTFTGAGTVRISGITLKTNSDYFLVVSGSSASEVIISDCYLAITDNTGIHHTSSSSSSVIEILRCTGVINTSGIALVTSTTPGEFHYYWSDITNPGGTSTASTFSSGQVAVRWSRWYHPITTSGTAFITGMMAQFDGSLTGSTSITCGGSRQSGLIQCFINSGSGSAISVSTGSVLKATGCVIQSTNTNNVTGAGTFQFSGLSNVETEHDMNTSTVTSLYMNVGKAIIQDAIQILAGSGSPSGSITAPKGSLYMRTDGSSTSTRAYINTNSGTSWSAITTAS